MARYGKARLGDMLVQLGHVLQDNLGQALEQQRQSGERLGKVLVERKFATKPATTKVKVRAMKKLKDAASA